MKDYLVRLFQQRNFSGNQNVTFQRIPCYMSIYKASSPEEQLSLNQTSGWYFSVHSASHFIQDDELSAISKGH